MMNATTIEIEVNKEDQKDATSISTSTGDIYTSAPPAPLTNVHEALSISTPSLTNQMNNPAADTVTTTIINNNNNAAAANTADGIGLMGKGVMMPPPSFPSSASAASYHPTFLFCGDCTTCGAVDDSSSDPPPSFPGQMLTTLPTKKKKKHAKMVFVSDFTIDDDNSDDDNSDDEDLEIRDDQEEEEGHKNNNINDNISNNNNSMMTSTITFEKLNPSQLLLVQKVMEGMEHVQSFDMIDKNQNRNQNRIQNRIQNHTKDTDEENGGYVSIQNTIDPVQMNVQYDPKTVCIDKVLESFEDLGLKNSILHNTSSSTPAAATTTLNTKYNNNQTQSSSSVTSSTMTKKSQKPIKCRSSFYVDGICCASEIPIVTSIIRNLPLKKQYIYKVSINVTNRMVYVEYDPYNVTANDILTELKSEGFSKSTVENDGNILFEKRRNKKKNKEKGMNVEMTVLGENKNGVGLGGVHAIGERVVNNTNVDVETGLQVTSSTTTTTPQFVESILYLESLSEETTDILYEVFVENDLLHDSIRSYAPNIASKTIKIEHDPKLISIQNILDTLMEDESGNTIFNKCSILVDGFREGLILPSTPTLGSMDGHHLHHRHQEQHHHAGDQNDMYKEREVHVDLRASFAAGKSSSSSFSSFRKMQKQSFRWFRAIGIGSQHGLSINIILSGLFWILSVIGHFKNDAILMYMGLFAVLFGLPPVAKKAFRTLKRKQFDANCMMVTAAVGALVLQEFDEAASVSFLFAISEHLEDRATRKAKKALNDIISLRPDHANYIDQDTGEIKIIAVNDLDIDDLVSVRMGDKIPSDGVVVEGLSQIDESSLTGESVPINKGIADPVSGGTINVGRTRLVVRITALVEDSAVSRLIKLVEESASSRSPTEQLVDQFARSYTPTVICIAFLMCTIPWFFGAAIGRQWMLNGLIIIVIACPCALTISTPVTYAAGLAATAQKGIIVKGGAKLEALGNVKKIIFDKTGTLTEGKFRLIDLQLVGNKKNRREVLELLAIMEGPSSHPLAATLVNAAKDEGVKISENAVVVDHSILKGEGVTAIVNNQETYVGNVRLFKRLGLYNGLSGDEKKRAIDWNNEGGTVGFVGMEGIGIIGMFCVADAVREEAKQVIDTFSKDGIEVFMLTGDGAGPAKAVAAEVGIPPERVRSQFLPEDKLHYVASMLRSSKQGNLFIKKELLLMCGDGVNDAPALAVADVGVAMGEGAALALEISDVTLMDSNLTKLLFSIQTGVKVIATVQENIAFSVAAKIIVIVLTLMGKMTLLAAIASDVGVMLLVSINGMKLLPGGAGLCCKRRTKYGKVPLLQEPMNSIV